HHPADLSPPRRDSVSPPPPPPAGFQHVIPARLVHEYQVHQLSPLRERPASPQNREATPSPAPGPVKVELDTDGAEDLSMKSTRDRSSSESSGTVLRHSHAIWNLTRKRSISDEDEAPSTPDDVSSTSSHAASP